VKLSTRGVYRLGAVAVILAAAWILVPRFGTESNLINLLRQAFLLALVATGVSLSMLVAGLDLSIGAVAALSSCLAATLIVQGHVVLGILTGLSVGALGAGLVAVAALVGVVESVMARLRLDRVPQFLVAASALAFFAVVLLLW